MSKLIFITTPKNKRDKKTEKIMSDFIEWEYKRIMKSRLATPFLRSINAINMSYLLFGHRNEEFIKKQEDLFLEEYKKLIKEEQNERPKTIHSDSK